MNHDSVPKSYLENIVAPACDHDARVLDAFSRVPRVRFIDEAMHPKAYTDDALPIGYGQTISRPSTVARMTKLLATTETDRILEIGTGSGFQAAILSRLVAEVYTVERLADLYTRTSTSLRRMRFSNIRYRCGNGAEGWPEEAPFDRIVATAEALALPEGLAAQLKEGGLLLIPLSGHLVLYLKQDGELVEQFRTECHFVTFHTGRRSLHGI